MHQLYYLLIFLTNVEAAHLNNTIYTFKMKKQHISCRCCKMEEKEKQENGEYMFY